MFPIFIYPDNLKAKLRLWELRDMTVIGAGLLLSVLALSHGAGMLLLVLTVLYAFLSIRMEGASILDFLRCAVCFLFQHQQYYSGVALHIYIRQATAGEEDTIIHNAQNKNRMDRGDTSNMRRSITAEANLWNRSCGMLKTSATTMPLTPSSSAPVSDSTSPS